MDLLQSDADVRYALLGIARKAVREHHRRLQRDRTMPLEDDLAELPDALESALDENEKRATLACALRKLALDDQLLLHLHYFENLSSDEISRTYGIPTPSLRSRLRRAKESLERALTATDVALDAFVGTERDAGQGSGDPLLAWIADMRRAT